MTAACPSAHSEENLAATAELTEPRRPATHDTPSISNLLERTELDSSLLDDV